MKSLRALLCLLPLVPHDWELRQSLPLADRLAAILYDQSSQPNQSVRWQEVCKRCGKTRPVANQSAGQQQKNQKGTSQ